MHRRDVLLLVAPDDRLPRRLLAVPAPLQPGHQLLRVGPDRQPLRRSSASATTRTSSPTRSSGRRPVNTAVMSGLGVAHPGRARDRAGPVLRPAPARHRGSSAACSSCRCCSRPIVVGLMWRALLNPDWGMVNWALGELGLPQPLWLADPSLALFTLVAGRLVAVDAVRHGHRVRASPGPAARRVRGVAGRRGGPAGDADAGHPAAARAGDRLRAIFRAIDAFRSFDIVFGLTYGGPGRFTTTLSFYTWENGFTFHALRVRVGDGLRHGHRRDRIGADPARPLRSRVRREDAT